MNTNHVVFRDNQMVCLHCGRSYTPNMPAPISMFAAMTNDFIRIHKSCRPPDTIEKRYDNSDFQTF